MSQDASFINNLKRELTPIYGTGKKGLALISKKGEILYSDLTSEAEQRIMRFKQSFQGLTPGSNITLIKGKESTIIICASEETLMAVETRQNVGFALLYLHNLIKKYEAEFKKYTKKMPPPA
jgi:hypothetical protein